MNIILKNYNDIKNNNVTKKNKMFGSDLNGYQNKIYICSDSEENINILFKNNKRDKIKKFPNITLNNIVGKAF